MTGNMPPFQELTRFKDIGPSIFNKQYLIPHLNEITRCNWYWGRMAAAEAERLLKAEKPGTFLLRESDKETFKNFTVSFKSFHRQITGPLHIKIELDGLHKFYFKCGSSRPHSADTIAKLIESYNHCHGHCIREENATKQLFTHPLNRNFPFSLLHLSRVAVISTGVAYEDVESLEVPVRLHTYLREYKYDINMFKQIHRYDWNRNFRQV